MTKNPAIILWLCWFTVVLDGFDLVVLGAALPSMLTDPRWEFTPAHATTISTAGLIGMMIGALSISYLTDRFGRRRVLMATAAAFSVCTLLLGTTTSVEVFMALRFLAGVGLGGALPVCIAIMTEFRPSAKAGSSSTLVMTGYHVGAVATALLGIIMIEPLGWQSLFIAGALPAIALVPALFFLMPESPAYLQARGMSTQASDIARTYGLRLEAATTDARPTNPYRTLLGAQYCRNTLAIWATSFMGLLLVYGLNTWLPQIMRSAQYDLGNSLGFLLVLNAGAVLGLLAAGAAADRLSPRTATLVWFACSAIFLFLLSFRLPLIGLYAMLLATGFFVFSSQVLVYGFVGQNHPASLRATAMGLSAGIGRLGAISGPIMGGFLVERGIAYPWGFYGFALAGLLGVAFFSFTRTLSKASA